MYKIFTLVALISSLCANIASADFVFDVGGGGTYNFVQNSGTQFIPIYVGTTAADKFTAVELFFSIGTSFPGGLSNGSVIGAVSQAGMVGNAQLQPGSIVEVFDAAGGIGRLNGSYSSSVTVAPTAAPLSGRFFANLFIDTSLFAPGTYTISDGGFINVLDGATTINSTLTSATFTVGSITAVPEPSSMALVGLCAVGFAVRKRFKKRAPQA